MNGIVLHLLCQTANYPIRYILVFREPLLHYFWEPLDVHVLNHILFDGVHEHLKIRFLVLTKYLELSDNDFE